MNNYKICFMMCSNNEKLAEECLLYIRQLEVPKHFTVDTKVIYGAKSMTAGYQEAMRQSDAKYKVYLHQDVLLIERRFIFKIVELFMKYPKIGMLGVVGNASLAPDGCPWSDGMQRRIGELYSDLIYTKTHGVFSKIKGDYQNAVVLDGLLLATQYDLPWRDDLFGGWDFYDCSQSLEFWRAGYQVVVPHMERPWCLHDNDILHLEQYEQWRRVFEQEYGDDYKNWQDGKMKKQRKIIYQKFFAGKSIEKFPYPPVYREGDTQYVCFVDDAHITSKHWDIQYVEDLDGAELMKKLPEGAKSYELAQNQIQIGPVFAAQSDYEPVVTVPAFTDLPGVAFTPEKLVPTADETGAYRYKKNPQYTQGAYGGRPLLLTIGVPVSNQIDTIERCLSHVKPLLDKLDAELLVVDTGSTDGTLDVCRRYGARIIDFPWCNNMSAARNEAVYHARGAWYLSIDDDEWFENVDEILEFFRSGLYKKCDTATYIQRNYLEQSGDTYVDNHTLRMAKITPALHFEGRIHDSLITPIDGQNCQLFSYAHHYGFARDNRAKSVEKFARNTESLLYDIYEYPTNLRYNFQLANELKVLGDFVRSKAYFFRGLSVELETPDAYFKRLHVVNLFACLYDAADKEIFPITALLEPRQRLLDVEEAFVNYNQAALALRFQKPADEILDYYHKYEHYKKRFEQNPSDSQIHSFIGLHVCEDAGHLMDSHVIAFCAYVQKQDRAHALAELKKIDADVIFDQLRPFFEHVLVAEDDVYETALADLSGRQTEQWREELLDAFFASICRDSIYERQFARFPAFAGRFSVETLVWYLCTFYSRLTETMRERLCGYAMQCDVRDGTVQSLYMCMYALKEQYVASGKKQDDREMFLQYITLMHAFCAQYYHPSLLQDAGGALPQDVLAAYHIGEALADTAGMHERIAYLKLALEEFPGFRSEIQYLSESLKQPQPESVSDEMARLAEQLIAQAKVLICQGKRKEAQALLKELAGYFPEDTEIGALLAMADDVLVKG